MQLKRMQAGGGRRPRGRVDLRPIPGDPVRERDRGDTLVVGSAFRHDRDLASGRLDGQHGIDGAVRKVAIPEQVPGARDFDVGRGDVRECQGAGHAREVADRHVAVRLVVQVCLGAGIVVDVLLPSLVQARRERHGRRRAGQIGHDAESRARLRPDRRRRIQGVAIEIRAVGEHDPVDAVARRVELALDRDGLACPVVPDQDVAGGRGLPADHDVGRREIDELERIVLRRIPDVAVLADEVAAVAAAVDIRIGAVAAGQDVVPAGPEHRLGEIRADQGVGRGRPADPSGSLERGTIEGGPVREAEMVDAVVAPPIELGRDVDELTGRVDADEKVASGTRERDVGRVEVGELERVVGEGRPVNDPDVGLDRDIAVQRPVDERVGAAAVVEIAGREHVVSGSGLERGIAVLRGHGHVARPGSIPGLVGDLGSVQRGAVREGEVVDAVEARVVELVRDVDHLAGRVDLDQEVAPDPRERDVLSVQIRQLQSVVGEGRPVDRPDMGLDGEIAVDRPVHEGVRAAPVLHAAGDQHVVAGPGFQGRVPVLRRHRDVAGAGSVPGLARDLGAIQHGPVREGEVVDAVVAGIGEVGGDVDHLAGRVDLHQEVAARARERDVLSVQVRELQRVVRERRPVDRPDMRLDREVAAQRPVDERVGAAAVVEIAGREHVVAGSGLERGIAVP